MAVKYRIEYTSVDGTDYTCDISNPSYSGSVITLDGRVEYGINSIDSLDHPIRSKYLRITVTANLTQDLEELLTQGERYWRVEFYRDVDKIFFGYLTSEQSPQDFVRDSWDLTLDAIDPMAYLEDLAYVDNTGTEYNGYDQFAHIIANCLKRGFESTSEEFNILTYVPFDYRTRTGIATYNEYTSGRFLKLCGVDQDGFIDSDTAEVLSCQEVLKDILSSLHLTITQINGDTWFISHYLYDSSGLTSTFIDYLDSDGDDIVGTPPDPFTTTDIKTDAVGNAFTDVIHINENQQYYFNYALGKNLYNFKFQYKTSMLDNPDLDGGTTGVSMPGFSFGDFGYPVDDGTFLVYRQDDAVNLDETAILSDTTLYVEDGQQITLQIVAETNYDSAVFRVQIEYEALSGTTYYVGYDYINPDGSYRSGDVPYRWSTVQDNLSSTFQDANGDLITGEDFTFTYDLPEIPALSGNTGVLKVRVLSIYPKDTSNTTDYLTVKSIDFKNETSLITGQSSSGTRTDIDAYKSEKYDFKFNTGENNSTYNTMIYLGSDRPIYQIRDRLSDASNYRVLGWIKLKNGLINNKLKKFFTGDFYNFFEPHNLINIPDLTTNDFRVLEYSFDTYTNIGTVKLEENETTDVSYSSSITSIYAETVKPTIK